MNNEPRVVPGQTRLYKTEALVLRSNPSREADRVLTVLTPGLGKLQVTVRGARRITSRMGGHLDVLNRVRLDLARGRRLDVVTNAEAIETFGRLKADLDRIAIALYIMELADALLPEASPHPATYALLLESLRRLDALTDMTITPRYAELKLLDDTGYMPELGVCVTCGSGIEPGQHRYSPSLGGALCMTCTVERGQVLSMSLYAWRVLRFFSRSDFQQAHTLKIDAKLADELEGILGASIHAVLEKDINSAAFIEQLRRLRTRTARRPAAP